MGVTRHDQHLNGWHQGDRPTRFCFLLVPGFALLPFSATIEPLRLANWRRGRTLYDWTLVSADGAPVHASNGTVVQPDRAMREVAATDTAVVVAGGPDAHAFDDRVTFGWLRTLARTGARIGAVGLGSYVLARAGLLGGRRCTIHWANLPSFREAFPDLDVTDELFEIDGPVFTCSGGTGVLDAMLYLVAHDHGLALARAVAEELVHERIRDPHETQRMALRIRLGISHPKLLQIVEIMEANTEQPLSRADLADQVGLTPRQMERLFSKYLGKTPTLYYRQIRLERARALLAQTTMSVTDVAVACGFVSASHFSKIYREQYDHSPKHERCQPMA
jgi:transcriptional regulator GlxA family with amidase domain